jgi:hypothetical protein
MALVATGLLLGAMGCGGSKTDRPVVTTKDGVESSSPAGTDAANRGKSLVRLVNALPSPKQFDVSGDDRTLFTAVEYKTVTDYEEIGGNLVTFRLRLAGADSVLADNSETLLDGNRYTIVALPNEHGGVALRVVRDEVVPDSGKARLRVINAAPDIDDVDIAVQGQKDPLFTDVGYATEAGYKDIGPMTATIDIRRDTKSTHPVQVKNMRFEAGRAYTIVLTESKPGSIETIAFEDAQGAGAAGLTLEMKP